MAYSGKNKLVGTNRAGSLNVDTLTVVTNAGNQPNMALVEGTLESWVQSITYATNTYQIVFKPDFSFQPGTIFAPRMAMSATSSGAQVVSWTPATRTLVIGFFNAGGTAAPPPAAPAELQLAAFICY